MTKILFTMALILITQQSFAKMVEPDSQYALESSAEAVNKGQFCGVAIVNEGSKQILDGSFNASLLLGDTVDTNKITDVIKDGECYCVVGRVATIEADHEGEENIFSMVSGLNTCFNSKGKNTIIK